MFTFDLEKAKSWRTSDSHVIVMFVVLLANGRKLPVYHVTTSSLMDVFDNIHVLRDFVVDFCSADGYKYGCLVGVSYVL